MNPSGANVYVNKEQPESTEFKLNEAASFRFHGEDVVADDLTGGGSLEFPLRLFFIVKHFSDWKPVFSAFMLPAGEAKLNYAEAFGLLRELIRNRILIAKKETDRDNAGITDRSLTDEIWSQWGSSLSYYLGSRTLADEPYFSLDELESRLAEKAKRVRQPSSFKDYNAHEFYPLDDPFQHLDIGEERNRFLDVLLSRRTSRAFAAEPLSKEQLSKLLYFTWGSTAASKNTMGEDVFLRKTSPSGGSLHSTEVYPILMNVKGVQNGTYHYSVRRHGLELLSREDPRIWVETACGGQKWISESGAVFLSTAVLYRMAWKYQSSRALRVVLHDIGHLSQTFCLVATWLGLGAFTTAALRDEVFEKKIGLDCLEEPVFLLNGAGNVRNDERGNERPREEKPAIQRIKRKKRGPQGGEG